MIKHGIWYGQPDFQRESWFGHKAHKVFYYYNVEGFPFPRIYIQSGIDLGQVQSQQLW